MTSPTPLFLDPLQDPTAPSGASPGTSQGAGDGGTATTQPPGDPGAGDPGTPPPPRSLWSGMVPFVLMFAILWLLVIRPERKRRKQTADMLSSLKKGDRVMTTSGMYAQVVQLADDDVTLQVADGVRIKFARAAIQSVVDKDESSD